jgi:hypothetical protein
MNNDEPTSIQNPTKYHITLVGATTIQLPTHPSPHSKSAAVSICQAVSALKSPSKAQLRCNTGCCAGSLQSVAAGTRQFARVQRSSTSTQIYRSCGGWSRRELPCSPRRALGLYVPSARNIKTTLPSVPGASAHGGCPCCHQCSRVGQLLLVCVCTCLGHVGHLAFSVIRDILIYQCSLPHSWHCIVHLPILCTTAGTAAKSTRSSTTQSTRTCAAWWHP